jgi:crotonobetaine/carnitine-CoA ligase
MTIQESGTELAANARWGDLEIDTGLSSVPQALHAAARAWPNRPVFHFIDQGFTETWSELEGRVLTVAAGLSTLGIRPGDRVGIMLANVPEFPAAWLGILATGAVAVPMNPKYTAKELAFIVEDTGMNAVFIASEIRSLVQELPHGSTLTLGRTVVVDGPRDDWGTSWEELLATPRWDEPYALGSAHDLANIQYTSGTTGLPKGCMLTHGYWLLMGRTGAALRGNNQNPVTSILADHPFFYIQNQSYFANALVTGAQLHVTHGLSLSRYIGWLNSYDIDMAWMSDALLNLPPADGDSTHSVRFAPTDAIDPSLHATVQQRFNVTVREWYASTEIGLGTISPWDDESAVGSGSMGYAAPFRETKIINDDLSEVPIGGTGELCVRGPAMMLGYWNRPEINAELFLDGGWFRTGDLVRITADGEHFFVGRAKDMVRRSGENIAAAEVEQQLMAHADVSDAAVIAVPDSYRGEEVKAVVVLREGATVTATELTEWCRQGLAPYKVPRYIAFREELPYTPSGKVRKAALKEEAADLRTGSFDAVEGIQR